ncbi:MFS transporter [Rhodococcus rhodnii]|uniref:Major facilitator transporter n=2 Tax=Rhodococcus rhodnii TaxID=38312 RepID=R7WPJ6_9NOCA|nr:MFS transporter [Rhodococcus rhodnii]EOM77233.1 major facilitator transporter [Rhodococcus rhodnii LMG 5362]TXG91990.1 MFS transporter [Rhodococcus rhodnii]
MIGAYRDIFRTPGSAAFSAAGFVARLPIAMVGIGTVTMISQIEGGYGLAGALAATLALSNAALTPVVSRAVDRYGQFTVLPIASGVAALAIASMLVGVRLDAPAWVLFVCAVPSGFMPTIGAMVRARWTEVYRGDERLRTAFAFESVVDEMCFIFGPVLAVGLSVSVAPEAGPLAGLIFLVVGTAALVVQRRTEPPVHPRGRTTASGTVLRLPAMWVPIIVMISLGAVFGTIDVGAIAFTSDRGQAGSATVVLALFAVGSAASGLVFGALRLVAPLRTQLFVAVSAVTILLVPLLFAGTVPLLTLAYVAAGATISPTMIITTALVERSVPVSALTEGITWTVAGIGVGVSLGSAVAGQMIDRSGTTAAFAVALGGVAVATMVTAWLFVRPPRPTGPPSSTP